MPAPLQGAGVSPFPPNPHPSSVDLANRSESLCRGTSVITEIRTEAWVRRL